MRIVSKISLSDLRKMAAARNVEFAKAVADIKQYKIMVDMDMHVDGEREMIKKRIEPIWSLGYKNISG